MVDLAKLRKRYPTEERVLADHEVSVKEMGATPRGGEVAPLSQLKFVTVTGFAAADWEYVLPQGYNWRFSVGTAILHASATAGSRFLGFHIYDNSSGTPGIAGQSNKLQYGVPNAQAVAANQVGNAHYYRGDTLVVAGLSAMIPVPDILLPPGWAIGSETFPTTGDTWTQITFLLEGYYLP